MQMDELLYKMADKVKNFAVIFLVDVTEVPDFNKMYELYDPCTVMFFYRNKHIMIDLGTGNNNKINWALEDPQEMIDIVETVYRYSTASVIPTCLYSSSFKSELFKLLTAYAQLICFKMVAMIIICRFVHNGCGAKEKERCIIGRV